MYITKIYFRQKIIRRSSWLNETTLEKNCSIRANWGFLISVDLVNIVVNTEYPDLLEGCSQLTRLDMKKCQAVTTSVKIYLERKMQNVKEFHQIENEIPLILHISINQRWLVVLSCNAVSFNCWRHSKRNRNIFEKCKMKCVVNYFCVIPKNQGLHKSTAHISSNNSKGTNHISLTGTDNCYCKLSKNTTLEENFQENQRINYISGTV